MSPKAKPQAGRPPSEFLEHHAPTYERHQPNTILDQDFPSQCRRYIITAAQNATPVHEGFFSALQQACKVLNARLVVITLRYKNPTSRWSGSQRNAEWWAPAVRPYLYNQRRRLNANLTLAADVKTQPTASDPLSGFDAMSLSSSGIIGHPKMAMRSVPTAGMAKLISTTGACTVPNYTDSRAGKAAEFHHSLAAVLVELDGKRFHLRQMHFDSRTQSCTDLATRYTASGAGPAPRALALVMGDTHVDSIDPSVERALFGNDGMVKALNPAHLVYHDLLDGQSVNPHTAGNPFVAVARASRGMDCVQEEVRRAVDFVLQRLCPDQRAVIVPSNHNDFLQRWLSSDWRTQPRNAEMYLETALAFVRASKEGGEPERFDAFAYWMRRIAGARKDVVVLERDQSFVLGGIELGLHGDDGPNGARGSILNLRRIGVKTVIGHAHSPGINEGAYQVGTSTKLRLGYNTGPSSWMHTMCVVYADEKRCLIHVTDGVWALMRSL